jgi:hypothetical protein
MYLRKLVVIFILITVGLAFLPTTNVTFSVEPKRIDASFYQDVYRSSQEEIIIIKFKEDSSVSFQTKNQNPYVLLPISKDSYAQELYDHQMDWVDSMKKNVPFTLLHNYQQVYNGVAIKIRGYNIPHILKDARVDRIFDTRDLNYLTRQFSVSTISAKPVWNL